jgi:histidyl-tRNA synthetase
MVIGPKELESGKAKLRDMKTGKETEVKLDNIKEVKKYFS